MKTLMQNALVLVILAMVVETQAQVPEQKNRAESYNSSVQLIPNVGLSSFKFVNSGMNLSSRGGIVAGMLVNVPTPSEGFIFETGLDYFEAGGKEDISSTTYQEIELGYLALPLKAKYEFYNSGEYAFYGKAGTAVAFLMTSKAKAGDTLFGIEVETDTKDETNKVDYIGIVGIGGDRQVAGGKVNVDLEYNKGTQRTFKSAGQDEKIEGYTLRVGYAIAI